MPTRYFIVLIAALAAAVQVVRADIPENKQYPAFTIGVTGIEATIEPGRIVTVANVASNSPASGRLRSGDVLLAVNTWLLDVADPRVPLGAALTEAEGSDGELTFKVRRGGSQQEVVITIPVLGKYSPTWPLNCKKSDAIIAATARRLAEAQNNDGSYQLNGQRMDTGLTGCMATLFLLSLDDEKYMPNVERFVMAVARRAEQTTTNSSAWHAGYQGILLAEYYLKTGDKRVLPGLEQMCKAAAEGQFAGSWGHSLGGRQSVGYVQSGQMNSAGVTVFTMLTLARECGITVSEEAFRRSLVFYWRMVGHGSVCYGDHRAEIYADTNGRNGALLCTLSLLGMEPYQSGTELLALMVADSYSDFEGGHTGNGFNVMWRGISIVHLPKDKQEHYRNHMAEMAWYYDLCRRPDGSFNMLATAGGEKRYTPEDWGYSIALTYTAPRKTLRITGAPRTKYSVRTPALPKLPWGTQRDLEFVSPEHAAGYGSDIEPPHVTIATLKSRERVPVEYLAKMMCHYNPVIRTWAAQKLGSMRDDAAYRVIAAGLGHKDPRVRRAACDAISGYTNWGAAVRRKLPTQIVSQRFMAGIERILRDRNAAWWEIDGALWALANAEPDDIRRNAAVIRHYAGHEEWYLRESSYFAVVGLGKEMNDEEFLFLADMYVKSRHVYERSSYDGGIAWLIERQKLKLDGRTIAMYVRKIGAMTHTVLIAAGYDKKAAEHEAAHRIMMTLARFDPAPYKVMVPDLVKYLSDWTPDYQHSHWLIVGSNWQPGLVKIADELGKDAGPLIDAFEQRLAKVNWNDRERTHRECREAMQKAVAAYRAKYR